MDGIQVHKGDAAPADIQHERAGFARNQSGRGEDDVSLLRALRRRFWMVLSIAVPLAIASSILVLGFRRSTWPRARSRSTPRPSTLSSRRS